MIIGKPRRMPASRCLSCGKKLDGASQFDGDSKPVPGSLMICLDCGHVMVTDDRLLLRELTDAEIVEAAGDPTMIEAQNMRADYIRWKERNER